MKHTYYRLVLLLALWSLVQLVSGQGLTLTGLAPTRNARSAPQTTNVGLTFNQGLSNNAATLNGVRVFSAQRGGLLRNGQGGSASVSGSTLSFNPTTNFKPGETVYVTSTTAIQSTGGARLSRGQVYQFTTGVGETGTGNFTAPATNPEPGVGSRPASVAVGDVDGDGDLDLLTANYLSSTVSVRLNNGSGNFTAPAINPEPGVGSIPYSVAVGDVDGDGDLDFVTANFGDNNVSVRLNNGRGNFTAPASNPEPGVGAAPQSVALGDVDGDGDLDLLCANSGRLDHTVSVRLNNGSGNFTNLANYAIDYQAQCLALGDVDGDGDLDFVVGTCSGNQCYLRLEVNDGSGNFTSREIAYGDGIYSVAFGDLDGDGDLDLLHTNSGFNAVTVLLNDGSGNFTGQDISVGNSPQSVAVGDVDGDGDLDVVTANASGATVSVRLNDGTAHFTAQATNAEPGVGSIPVSVALGDVDGDGDLDVVTANQNSNTVSVRLNRPYPLTLSGLSASPNSVCVGQPFTINATLVTLDDLSTGYSYTLTSGTSTTTGSSTSAAFSQTLMASGSGTQTVILTVSSRGQVVTATTTLTVTQCFSLTGLSPARNARSAPANANVVLTFAQPLSNNAATLGGVRVFSAQRGGLLRNGQGGSASVAGNRLNFNPSLNFKPGETVLVTSTTAIQGTGESRLDRGQVYGFTTGVGGTGRGNFTAPAINPEAGVVGLPVSVAVGDVDGDGDLDLLTANEDNSTVSVRLNNGSGNFTAPAVNPNPGVGSSPTSVALGDVDGDGDLDVVTANRNSANVSVRLNNGSGNFTAPATNPEPGVGFVPVSVALGDVDGDGDLDLLTANQLSSTVSVRLNDGSGNFTTPATNSEPGVGSAPTSVALGDVDGDGDLDVVTANASGATVSVRLNNGSGNFTAPAVNPELGVGGRPYSVALGDVDGDGDLDVVTANQNSNTVSVRLNDGSGNFTAPAINPEVAVGDAPRSVAVGDVDGDGDLDLLTANQSSPTVSVRLNNGSGNFTAPATNPEPGVGTTPLSVALGDVDGDGDLDFVAANVNRNSVNTVSVRLNSEFFLTVSGLSASPNPVCAGQPVSVVATVNNFNGGYSYTLTNGSSVTSGTATSSAFNQRLTAGGPGVQSVTLTVSSNGQQATATTLFSVTAPSPTLISSGPLTCANTSVTLTAGGGSSYRFASESGVLGVPGPSNTVVVSRAGTYSVTVTDAMGCSAVASTRVESRTATVTITNPTVTTATTRQDFTQSFRFSNEDDSYSYSLNSGSLPPGLSLLDNGAVQGSPTQAGSFTITAKATGMATGCSGISSPYVLTVTDPTLTLAGLAASHNPVCVGQPFTISATLVTLDDLSVGYSYTLTSGTSTTTGSSTSAAFSQTLMASGLGTQTVILTVSSRGQVVTATTILTVTQCFSLTGLSPARNARSASANANVVLTFAQPLSNNAATLGGVRVFSAQRGGLLRNGQGGSASVSGSTLNFNPSLNFKPGETVYVTSTTAIQGTGGDRLDRGQVYGFTTGVGGTGRGNFTAPAINPELGVGDYPQNVAVGDVDGDGDLDLLCANQYSNSVSVRLNNGSGNFIAPAINPELGVRNYPQGVALGDVDGDGDLDLLCANSFSDNVSVRLNDGTGNFTPPAINPEFGVGGTPYSVALGDVDGDGDLDVVTANYNGNTVSVRLNDGGGNFTAPAVNPEPGVGNYPQSVALGDVDGDGDLDLVTANSFSDNVSVRLNDGTGNFTPPAITPEIVVGSNPVSVALGDVDGDGDLDLLTANGSSTVSVRLNNGLGNFTAPAINPEPGVGNYPSSVALGDVDGDGDLDLLTANGSSTVSVRLNNGSGNFIPPAINPEPGVGSGPYSVALGDVDGDGDLDLLTANSNSASVSVRLNGGPPLTLNLSGLSASPNPVCAGQALSLTASVGNLTTSYSYTLSNGSTTLSGSATTPTFSRSLTASGSGVQTFTLTVSSGGQVATATTSLTVNAPPAASAFASSTTALVGDVISLSASGGTSYLWTAPPGATLTLPATASTVSATLTSAGPQTFTVTVSQGSCSQTTTVTVTAIQLPDLTLMLYARPSTARGNQPITVVVDVFEINGIPTSGPITLKIAKDANLTLSFDGGLSSIGGRPVQNSQWTFGGLSGGYYTLTHSGVLSGTSSSVGLTGTLSAGSSTGVVTVSGIVLGGGDGTLDNNTDADKIEYFQQ
ncbi:FG-GAP-like repeat-containing protein [Spirosoma koreense]